MELSDATSRLAALAQETRLAAFRRLIAAGPDGMAAGALATALGVPANTLSGHLAILGQAGLVRSERTGRHILYSADIEGMAGLLDFLTRDCCGGHPDLCRIGPPDGKTSGDIPMPTRPFTVLFLCTGNSARSILAEAILKEKGGDQFRALSAGSLPKGEVHPIALDLLRQLGHDTAFARSKSWEEFADPNSDPIDFVFTVCDNAAKEVCPVWPGQPLSAHWGVPDPAAATGTPAEVRVAFRDAYRMLERRISIFVSLPIATLDRMSLSHRLAAIPAEADTPTAILD